MRFAPQMVFENPAHDFPNWWQFSRGEDGCLIEEARGERYVLRHEFSRRCPRVS
ncbi:MAG TPA: hypothetical protein PLV45_15545 [bacterium]|nr:hypothetical protein [bacterium]